MTLVLFRDVHDSWSMPTLRWMSSLFLAADLRSHPPPSLQCLCLIKGYKYLPDIFTFRSLWRGAPPWHLPPAHWSSRSQRTPQSFECPQKIQTLALSEASAPLTSPHPSRSSWRSWNENGKSFLFNDFSSSLSFSLSLLALFQLFLTGVFSHLEHRSSSCPAFC